MSGLPPPPHRQPRSPARPRERACLRPNAAALAISDSTPPRSSPPTPELLPDQATCHSSASQLATQCDPGLAWGCHPESPSTHPVGRPPVAICAERRSCGADSARRPAVWPVA
eukprot:356096-Chlamydomonas_euryale.AAC.6